MDFNGYNSIKSEVAPTLTLHDGLGAPPCVWTKVSEPRVMQVGNLIPDEEGKFANPERGRVYSADGIAPCVQTLGGGNREPKIIEPINTTAEGISPTITAHYHKVGWSDLDPNCQLPHIAILEVYKNKHVQRMVESGKIDPTKVQYLDTYNQIAREDVASTISTRTDANNDCYVTEPITCASRKRGDRHNLEMGSDIANSITTIDTDSMIAEPQKEQTFLRYGFGFGQQGCSNDIAFTIKQSAFEHNNFIVENDKDMNTANEPKVLTQRRTDIGRELRKQGVDVFANKELVPREDGVSGTLTSVQKDNLLAEPCVSEPQVIGSNQKNAYRGSTDGVAPCVNAAMGMGGGHVPMVTEPKVIQKVGDRGTDNYSVKEISNTIPANPMSDREQMLIESKIVGYTRDEKGKVVDYHTKDVANVLHGSCGNGCNTDQYVAESNALTDSDLNRGGIL